MVKESDIVWDKHSVKEFESLMNDTMAIVDNEKQFVQACANRFAREAEKKTQKGKKSVYRKFYGDNLEYWLAPTDSRQTSFTVVAVNKIGEGAKTKNSAKFTPRGLGLHKLAWLAAARKAPFRFGSDGRTHRTGTKGARRWASIASRLQKKYGIGTAVEIANFAPAITKMERGGNGLKSRAIMGPAMRRTSRQVLYFMNSIKRRIRQEGWA